MFRYLLKLYGMFAALLLVANSLAACQASPSISQTLQGPLTQCTQQEAPAITTLAATQSSTKVFYLASNTYLYALNVGNGTLSWCSHYQAKKTYTNSFPAYFTGLTHVNSNLYIGTTDNNFFILNPANGSLLRSYLNPGGSSDFSNPMIVVNDKIYKGLNALEAIDAQTGKVSWKYSLERAQVASSLVVANDTLYLGTSANVDSPYQSHLFALDASTGSKRWDDYWNDPLIQGDTVVGQGVVLVTLASQLLAPGQTGTLQAVDAQTGKFLWHNNSGFLCSPSEHRDLFYGMEGNNLDAFNIQTGHILWTNPQIDPIECLVDHNILYVISDIAGINTVSAFNAQTGNKLWQAHVQNISGVLQQSILIHPMTLIGNELFLWTEPFKPQSFNPTLHAFNVQKETEDWYTTLHDSGDIAA